MTLRSTARWLALAAVILCGAAGAARGSFVLLEDFSGLTPGNISGQGPWHATGTSGQVLDDPDEAGNLVLAVTTDSAVLHRSAFIGNGTVRMMFVRFRFAGQQNYSFGLSDVPSPDQFGHFEVELSMSNADNDLLVANGDTAGTYDVLGALAPDTWYNAWIRVDNSADESWVYLNAVPGAGATEADRQATAGGLDVFGFRNGSGGDLLNFFIKTGGGSSENSGPLYLDDIYIEDTDALNLSNPIPEPATLALLAAGAALLLRRRTR